MVGKKAQSGVLTSHRPGASCTSPKLDSETTYGIWYANAPVLARHRPADQPGLSDEQGSHA